MSIPADTCSQLMSRIASDRSFRRLLSTDPAKAAREIGIAISAEQADEVLRGVRQLRERVEREVALTDAQMAPFVFAVFIAHDDGDAADEEDAPAPGSGGRAPEHVPAVH